MQIFRAFPHGCQAVRLLLALSRFARATQYQNCTHTPATLLEMPVARTHHILPGASPYIIAHVQRCDACGTSHAPHLRKEPLKPIGFPARNTQLCWQIAPLIRTYLYHRMRRMQGSSMCSVAQMHACSTAILPTARTTPMASLLGSTSVNSGLGSLSAPPEAPGPPPVITSTPPYQPPAFSNKDAACLQGRPCSVLCGHEIVFTQASRFLALLPIHQDHAASHRRPTTQQHSTENLTHTPLTIVVLGPNLFLPIYSTTLQKKILWICCCVFVCYTTRYVVQTYLVTAANSVIHKTGAAQPALHVLLQRTGTCMCPKAHQCNITTM